MKIHLSYQDMKETSKTVKILFSCDFKDGGGNKNQNKQLFLNLHQKISDVRVIRETCFLFIEGKLFLTNENFTEKPRGKFPQKQQKPNRIFFREKNSIWAMLRSRDFLNNRDKNGVVV